MLKKSESRDIGVIIPTISNPFYPQLILGIELEARRRGLIVSMQFIQRFGNRKKVHWVALSKANQRSDYFVSQRKSCLFKGNAGKRNKNSRV